MGENNRILKMIIGIGLIVAGLAVALIMKYTRPQAERKPMSAMIPAVETAPLSTISTSVTVSCMGTVIADREAAIQAEVSGRIRAVMPGLTEGAAVEKGDVLLTIDPEDYALAVQKAQAALESARSALRLEEGQQAVARREMDLAGPALPADDAWRDLMLRQPQLKSAQAAVASAEASLQQALRNLERSGVTAPFAAVVQEVNAAEGDYASSGKTLVRLVASDRFFVRASIPISSLSLLPDNGRSPCRAEIILTGGEIRHGVLYQLLPDLSAQGRMARVLVAVENPRDAGTGRPMLLGEAVRVNLSGRPADEVCLIRREHVHDGPVIWMADPDRRLRICPVEIIQGYEDSLLVRAAFSPDWNLVVSGIPAPVEGMALNVLGAPERTAE